MRWFTLEEKIEKGKLTLKKLQQSFFSEHLET